MRRRPANQPAQPRSQQPTPDELLEDLCQFVRRQFYPDNPIQFAKDRPRLLSWVLLYPAEWLDERAVTLPPERYKAILIERILLPALRNGNTSKVQYIPAWLRMTVRNHFEHHGEKYYAEAKSIRNLADHALLVAGRLVKATAPDPVRELAAASRLLKAKKKVVKTVLNDQLTLL